MANENNSASDIPSGMLTMKSRGSSSTVPRVCTCDRWMRPSLTHCSRMANGLSIIEPVCNRHPAIAAKRARRDFHTRCSLAPLVFIRIDHTNNPANELFVETHVDHLGKATVVLDIRSENRIKDVVGRQTVGIQLIWTKFGGRGLFDNSARNAPAVLRQSKNGGLHHVFQHSKPSSHIPVQSTVTGTDFAFVAGAQHEPSELVRKSHQIGAANPGLNILFGNIGLRSFESLFERGRERL